MRKTRSLSLGAPPVALVPLVIRHGSGRRRQAIRRPWLLPGMSLADVEYPESFRSNVDDDQSGIMQRGVQMCLEEKSERMLRTSLDYESCDFDCWVVDGCSPTVRRLNALAYTHTPHTHHTLTPPAPCPPRLPTSSRRHSTPSSTRPQNHGQHTPDKGPLPHRLQAVSHRESP